MSERLGAVVFALLLWLVSSSGTPSAAASQIKAELRQEEEVARPRWAAAEGDSHQSRTHRLQPTAAETLTTIRVFAEGLHREAGQVRISLFATPEGFPDQGERCLQWGFARLLGDQAYLVFAPVRPGSYAVAVFHDEDGNGKMRKDWLGRPKEGWGVSRDAQGRFGPPRFEDAAFEAAGDTMTIHLQLRY